jgi:hypothetical protein
MKKIINKIRYLSQLIYNFIFTNKTKVLTIRVIFMSAYYRLAILIVPMEKLKKYFGFEGKESPEEESYEKRKTAFWIGQRVTRVSRKTTWESKCLVQALVAQQLLIQKDIHSTLYLGVGKEASKMIAHAWLRCGSVYVTGGDGSDYAIVTKFYK